MDKNKSPLNNSPCPNTESSDSVPLCVQLAHSFAKTSHAVVQQRYTGDGKPIYVDRGS